MYDLTHPFMFVPKGTVIPPKVQMHVERFRIAGAKSAAAILGLAMALAAANEELNEDDFHLFCYEVNLDPRGSTFRKLMQIAKNCGRFQPYMDKLPQAWTTIYKLSTLSAEKFEYITPLLNPLLTADEIDEALEPDTKTKANDELKPIDIRVSVNAMTKEDVEEVAKSIRDLHLRQVIEVKIPKTVNDQFSRNGKRVTK